MTPPRLLSTSRNPFERQLLASAGTECAPEAVRARVLANMAQVLSSAEPAAEGRSTLQAGRGARGVLEISVLGTLRQRGARLASAGLVALAAGIALLMTRPTNSELPAASLADPVLEGARAAEARGLAATSAHASTSRSATSPHTEGALLQSLAEDDAPDWLGAQLQLLSQARGHLRTGALQQAGALLDSYEQRFPGGVMGPQISALRQELRLRRERLVREP